MQRSISFNVAAAGLLIIVALWFASRLNIAGTPNHALNITLSLAALIGAAAFLFLSLRRIVQSGEHLPFPDEIEQEEIDRIRPPARPRHQKPHLHLHPIIRDLGVLLYGPTKKPTIYRESALPDNITHVRPFVLVWVDQSGNHFLRFELRDGDGVTRLVDAAIVSLEEGETFTPSESWLPLGDGLTFDSSWTLFVYQGDDILAVQDFEADAGGGELRAYLDGDGEIRDDLLAALEAASDEQVSLDELLGE